MYSHFELPRLAPVKSAGRPVNHRARQRPINRMADSNRIPLGRNVAVANQIANNVAATVATYTLATYPGPAQVAPHHLMVTTNNIGGQSLTWVVIHQNIIPSIRDDGFDPSRTPVGYAIWYESSQAKGSGIAHNLKPYGCSALLPPTERDVAQCETLSCSHCN